MRRIMIGDICALARVLQPLPRDQQSAVAAALLEQAHMADVTRKRLGRVHPLWGSGSLMARALLCPAKETYVDLADPKGFRAFEIAVLAIKSWRALQSERGRRRANDAERFP